MQVAEATLPPSPGEQYVKALWQGRWLFLLIVAIFVGGAAAVTALLTKSYTSEALLSVRVTPRLDPSVTPYSNPDPLYPSAITSSGNPAMQLDEQGAARLVRRFQTNSLVTAAARDAGIITPTGRLDDLQVRRWVVVEALERTDLVTMTVKQPTAEKAQQLATALVARAIVATRSEATADPTTRGLLEQELQRATAAMTGAEAALAQPAGAAGAARDIALDRAKLELSLAREQYSAVRRRLGMLDLTVANQQFLVTVVDPPTLPLRPTFPRPLLNLSIGLILGVVAATTFISLRSVLRKV